MVNGQVRLFCGEKDPSGHVEDPETWLNHFERMSITNGWNTDIHKKQHFQVYLTGEAEAWYMVNQNLINNPTTTWQHVRGGMITRFRPDNYMEELEKRLRNPVARIGESVRAYEERFINLHTQVGPLAPALASCHTYWISGLKPSIRKQVRFGRPTNFSDAVKLARADEATERAEENDEKESNEGLKPYPLTKNQSANISEGDFSISEGLGTMNPRPIVPTFSTISTPSVDVKTEDDP
jgi:hypothetical protein